MPRFDAVDPRTLPWSPEEREVLAGLRDPAAIQDLLDTIPYSGDPIYRCPRAVLRDRRHGRDAPLFEGRSRNRLIEDGDHLTGALAHLH